MRKEFFCYFFVLGVGREKNSLLEKKLQKNSKKPRKVSGVLVGGQCLKALSRLLGPENSSSPLTLSQWIAVYAALQASSAFVPSLASSAAVAGAGSAAFLLFWFLATWFSAAAGVQRHTSSVPPLPSDFYSLAADSPHERAFAALGGL